MTSTAAHPPRLVYVECDVPEGLTLSEWRRARHVEHVRRSCLVRLLQRVRRGRR
jgi:hypothetical protein